MASQVAEGVAGARPRDPANSGKGDGGQMNLEEIEQRVQRSLEALNSPDEIYDWRLTHYNSGAWANLQEGSYFLSEGKIEETTFKILIKTFRDLSFISYIDFHIKVPEPRVEDFRRMALLFGPLNKELRLIPPRTQEQRAEYLRQKTTDAVRLTIDCRQVISEKLRQQFTYLLIRTKERPLDLLAIALNFENYNPYQKKLLPAPAVVLGYHLNEEEETAKRETEENLTTSDAGKTLDNAEFELRLAPTPVKFTKPRSGTGSVAENFRPAPAIAEAPHELPGEIHEEFAAYCQNLYEKAKGN